jgi:2-methylisocitrate lyase-like PEP mutase family enzyme
MTQPDRLRDLLKSDGLLLMPCCFDALSAKLVAQQDFALTFMSGFAASASRIGAPDLGLMSYGEVIDQARNICDAVDIPVLGDGDTGHGNAMNVRRTVRGFSRAGCAAVMIEDQLAPKRCGHMPGKAVVSREEAFDRIKAAVDARAQDDILILARTDARHEHGLGEAIARAQRFHDLGADILFVEAPRDTAEMRQVCADLPGYKLANVLEGGQTPDVSQAELHDMGYKIAAHPLTLMAAAMKAMVSVLGDLKRDADRTPALMDFVELRARLGFDEYYDASSAYGTSRREQ